MHPDKNPGREAEFTVVFQTLLNHFKLLGEVIKENIKDKNVSDEESYEVHLFNSFNFQKQNTNCYVVYIENALSIKWNDVLTHKYGVHKDGTEKNNGTQFKTLDASGTEIFICHYHKPKDGKSKLHIQSKSQIANSEFIFGVLADLYGLVRAAGGLGVGAAAAPAADAAHVGAEAQPAAATCDGVRPLEDVPAEDVALIADLHAGDSDVGCGHQERAAVVYQEAPN